ncbi:CatB-related O-acetyltransferase [Parvularcula sp. LCG005]|uniref:CatB-related O-acetyltransferase n=1 Tax=Parvularcula sp. LCG005 TaxID=3078805 RepID=UPI002942D9D0|nr:CatB-related O-acetyltransferase [Parvularcula sp. LCG005]WOI52143.1 CatB-related O-acetyltransferase [Parvularcula sp. LCG005]
MTAPDPDTLYPMGGFPQAVFLKNVITRPNIEVGDYTYYDDPAGAERWEEKNVLYHFDFHGDRLKIGRFCALAQGSQFIMNGANHLTDGFSTFPFAAFGQGWEEGFDPADWSSGVRGDTVVGHDVWIGRGAVIMPGITIGNGAIIGAHAVVAQDVPAYGIVVGNSARVIRTRFASDMVKRLEDVAWWNWSAAKITRNVGAIRGADINALEAAAAAD